MTQPTEPSCPKRDCTKAEEDKYVQCEHCALFPLCNPLEISGNQFDLIEGLLQRRVPLAAGEVLFGEGDAFNAIYAISAGAFKLVLPDEQHKEKVCGFSFSGELVGYSGMAVGHYPYKAIALEQSYVCEIPYQRLMDYADKVPELRSNLFTMLSMESFHSQLSFTTLMGRKNVDQRVAAFFINLEQRTRRRGFDYPTLTLSMRRDDIANFLGLPKETLSRALSKFQQQGLIDIDARKLVLTDYEQLLNTAGLPQPKAD
ncbi:helix-turn-helix domain-containing protein [Aestuariirhabdus sp. Z084]|uniref:helix-turn-helix domain-containing protein n=1 Tax=Aestuariirhabdus haliotis TaxID=2918751 RepID=UPI00201B3982|nr:helix-turn-helix domain-containing protein [Aestuariirhabdus haliotis]MCL6415773.1 helix-turn-helix domain-containing protein [Aestuariirhabdus haliotis]MCL6419690.1 helix-turn-helix domain-containing protein [Aestuariirhabdus haliotis]